MRRKSRAELYKQMLRVEREAAGNGHTLGDFLPHAGGPLQVGGVRWDAADATFKVATCPCGARAYVTEAGGFAIDEIVRPCSGREELKKMSRIIARVPGPDPTVQFNVVLVSEGDRYGLDDRLVWDKDEPAVEFYDVRYDHTPRGQFVARYYAETLLSRPRGGLDLYGGADAWKVDGAAMLVVIGAVAGATGRVAELVEA